MTAGVRAAAIAQPVWLSLSVRPFWGRTMGCFEHACNLIDREGRIIALTGPSIGKGPFCIVLRASGQRARSKHADSHLFDHLRPGQSVHIDIDNIALGDCRIPLSGVPTWDAMLPRLTRPLSLMPSLTAALHPYTVWPRRRSAACVDLTAARLLAQGAHDLTTALERQIDVAAAAQHLAGLGPGLTPAGDDYVLGVMAALWLLDESEPLPAMAAACATRTTHLSGAFLRAAAQGHFMEAWHHLAHALGRKEQPDVRRAVQRIAAFGASSGYDSLAGFARTLLSRART